MFSVGMGSLSSLVLLASFLGTPAEQEAQY